MNFDFDEDFSEFKKESPLTKKLLEELKSTRTVLDEIIGSVETNEVQKAYDDIKFLNKRYPMLSMLSDLLEQNSKTEFSEEEVEDFYEKFEALVTQSMDLANMLGESMGLPDPSEIDFSSMPPEAMEMPEGMSFEDLLKPISDMFNSIIPGARNEDEKEKEQEETENFGTFKNTEVSETSEDDLDF